jgi:hypothetical protein
VWTSLSQIPRYKMSARRRSASVRGLGLPVKLGLADLVYESKTTKESCRLSFLPQHCIVQRRYTTSTYDHRLERTGHPVRSAIHNLEIGRLVVGWVTTSEYLLLYVFAFHFVLILLPLSFCKQDKDVYLYWGFSTILGIYALIFSRIRYFSWPPNLSYINSTV